MKLSPRRTEQPDVNLTPMIDVVFLLLLFFMVSTSFIQASSIKVNLPEAKGTKVIAQNKPITIQINQKGEVIINDQPLMNVTQKTLGDLLTKVVGTQNDPQIIIRADAKAPYQVVVTAMDTAQQLGYNKLTLATRQQ